MTNQTMPENRHRRRLDESEVRGSDRDRVYLSITIITPSAKRVEFAQTNIRRSYSNENECFVPRFECGDDGFSGNATKK